MKRLLIGAMAFVLGTVPVMAQSLEDLNIQIHGYATQGFLYTTQNNIFTTNSSNGSPAWTEAVVNVTALPEPKLRVGVQARYFLLGNLGNAITLDWASADYKVNDHLGVRFGKVKTPTGLFNEIQDIDPSYMWSLLPQGIYPITSRNTLLAHYGGVVYGTVKLDRRVGKFEYRAFGGERVLASNDGYFIPYQDQGFTIPNGENGPTYGGALHWITPLPGLMVGASDFKDTEWTMSVTLTVLPGSPFMALVPVGTILNGTAVSHPTNEPSYFGRYEKKRIMVAGEHMRLPLSISTTLPALGPYGLIASRQDQRSWYGMASYKVTDKLSAGLYESQFFNRQAALGPGRYSKDWAVSGRYDFNQYVYAKAEQHFVEGTGIMYDTAENRNGMQPNTRLTILKIGVSF
jgi:hypothetical protein